MSRRDRIREAAKYLGLSAAHWACYGTVWKEVGDYRNRADDILGEMSLNRAECEFCRDVAIRRAERYVRAAYATPGKTHIPRTVEEAIALAVQEIERVLGAYCS